MLHEFFRWIQQDLGKSSEYGPSWSEALLGSLNFWGLLEGTHLIMLMLFFGTILVVDLRLLGVLFKETPVSVLSKKVLPLTVFGFAAMIVTGLLLYFARPMDYYHNVWFRFKMVFLLIAMINIVVFHTKVQRNIEAWDTASKTPTSARVSAVLSLTAWFFVIMFGRFIAYSWFECGKPQPAFINAVQECAAWPEKGAIALGGDQ